MRLPELANADADLLRRAAACTLDFNLGVGEALFHVGIAHGRTAIQRGPALMRSAQFSIRAEAESWLRFWRPLPQPGWHDLLALTKRGVARIDGDFRPLMVHLQIVKDVLAAPRRLPADVAP